MGDSVESLRAELKREREINVEFVELFMTMVALLRLVSPEDILGPGSSFLVDVHAAIKKANRRARK